MLRGGPVKWRAGKALWRAPSEAVSGNAFQDCLLFKTSRNMRKATKKVRAIRGPFLFAAGEYV
jgi:hypothetical protein